MRHARNPAYRNLILLLMKKKYKNLKCKLADLCLNVARLCRLNVHENQIISVIDICVYVI